MAINYYRDIYNVAHHYAGEVMDYYGFTYPAATSMYNLNYFRGKPRYVGGSGPGGPSPGYFSGGTITLNDFYNTDGNCNCNCNCDCACACDCACNC